MSDDTADIVPRATESRQSAEQRAQDNIDNTITQRDVEVMRY